MTRLRLAVAGLRWAGEIAREQDQKRRTHLRGATTRRAPNAQFRGQRATMLS